MGKCIVCTELKQQGQHLHKKTDSIKYQQWLKQKDAHDQLHSNLRKEYETRKAACYAEDYTSIIIDSMQHQFLPHFVPVPKGSTKICRLKVHVTGLIDHRNNVRKLWFVPDHWDGHMGANYTISLLHDYIRELLTKQTPRCEKLWIQMDNCGKDNKNQYIFGYLAFLIHLGWFKEINVSMLMVGHTHADIDQMFSHWGKNYFNFAYHWFDEMIEVSKKMYRQSGGGKVPEVKLWDEMRDWKKWMEENNSLCDISNFNHCHSFRFCKDHTSNQVKMWVKEWPIDTEWQGFRMTDQDPFQPVAIFRNFPKAQPQIILPNTPYDQKVLKEIMDNFGKLLTKLGQVHNFNALLSNEPYFYLPHKGKEWNENIWKIDQFQPVVNIHQYRGLNNQQGIAVDLQEQTFVQHLHQPIEIHKHIIYKDLTNEEGWSVGKIIRISSTTEFEIEKWFYTISNSRRALHRSDPRQYMVLHQNDLIFSHFTPLQNGCLLPVQVEKTISKWFECNSMMIEKEQSTSTSFGESIHDNIQITNTLRESTNVMTPSSNASEKQFYYSSSDQEEIDL